MGRLRTLVVVAALAAATGLGLVPLASAPAGAAVATSTVDPMSRASVLAAYRSLVAARAVPTGWTGSASTCAAGTESAASIEATRSAVNLYRALNGLPAIAMDSAMNRRALSAALIMEANRRLTHTPAAGSSCWTAEGSTAAGASNLAKGTGADAIDQYMADLGAQNAVAGHRRWILNPVATTLGTGSTKGYNAVTVVGGSVRTRPAGVTWVAWPNAGFVPKRALRPYTWLDGTALFSLSSNRYPDADYSSARVSVKVGSATLAVDVNTPHAGYGDSTLTWDVTMPAGYDTSDADVRFDIAVSGVRTAGGQAIPTYAYSSTAVVNAAPVTVPGAPTATATAANARATVSWSAPTSDGGSAVTGYKVTPYAGATALPAALSLSRTATSLVVAGLTNDVAYTFKVQAVNAIGTGTASAASVAVTPTSVAPRHAPYASWDHLVDQVFRQMVGRSPTGAESTRWAAPLQAGTKTPGDLVAELRRSSHHTTVVDPVTRLYRAYYLRIPDRAGLEYWIAQRVAGRSMASISGFFARSSELVELYGSTTDQELVELIYQNILGRAGEPSGVAYWAGEITSGRRSPGEVMLGFSESGEYRTAQSSETTVSVLHVLLLDRAPTPQELADGVAALDGGQSVADYAEALLPRAVLLP